MRYEITKYNSLLFIDRHRSMGIVHWVTEMTSWRGNVPQVSIEYESNKLQLFNYDAIATFNGCHGDCDHTESEYGIVVYGTNYYLK